MADAPKTLDGWYTLHDFRTIDWTSWRTLAESERREILTELRTLTDACTADARDKVGSYGQYAIAGHKADLLFLHMRPTIEELTELKTKFNKTRFAEFIDAPYSYVSVVELGAYLAKPGVDVETDPHLQSRLKPTLPDMSHVCFYPMNKKREGNDNWYMLSNEERGRMMMSHGTIGRGYAERVKQIITGSIGLDDWEWGVTLFANDPLEFKKLVHEMRFDEVSARFAEFGPFLVGHSLTEQGFDDLMQV